jgi:peptide/nickel transport system ATP-binding protein
MLEVDNLTVSVPVSGGRAEIVRQASLSAGTGEIVGLIGESGAGKSTLARAVLGLLPEHGTAAGRILWQGSDVLTMARAELGAFRSRTAAMITQDPRASVNPMHSVGVFVTETLRARRGQRAGQARSRAVAALDAVGLDGWQILRRYPHQLSGGMLQRVVIAAALCCEPDLLIADEPTTALDVTTQAEIMAILCSLSHGTPPLGTGDGPLRQLTILLVTHNLELAAAVCDRIYVMRAGEIVEDGPAQRVLSQPRHIYTAELRAATAALSGLATAPDNAEAFPPARGPGPDAGEGAGGSSVKHLLDSYRSERGTVP